MYNIVYLFIYLFFTINLIYFAIPLRFISLYFRSCSCSFVGQQTYWIFAALTLHLHASL